MVAYVDWFIEYESKSTEIGFDLKGNPLPPIYPMEDIIDSLAYQVD